MSGAVKKATGLTGLAVATNPQHTLGVLYGKILRALQHIPPDAKYRHYTEEVVTNRAAIVKKCSTSAEIEKQINCGQVEELIIQAENELSLARNMVKWKAWEPLVNVPVADQWKWPPTQ